MGKCVNVLHFVVATTNGNSSVERIESLNMQLIWTVSFSMLFCQMANSSKKFKKQKWNILTAFVL